AAVACVSAGVFLLTDNPGLTARAAGLVAAAMLVCLLTGSARVVSAATAAARLARRPRVRWGLLTAAGFATVIGSAVAFEVADNAAIDQQMQALDAAEAAPR